LEEGRRAFKLLTGTATRKRPLGRPRCRWEDNIRMDLKEININMRNWVDSALVKKALNLRVPKVMELISYQYEELS
jgi:Phosphate-selective porin